MSTEGPGMTAALQTSVSGPDMSRRAQMAGVHALRRSDCGITCSCKGIAGGAAREIDI